MNSPSLFVSANEKTTSPELTAEQVRLPGRSLTGTLVDHRFDGLCLPGERRILGIDGGLRQLGWCLLETSEDGPVVRGTGLIGTTPNKHVDPDTDMVRRVEFVMGRIIDAVDAFVPQVVAVEGMIYPDSKTAICKLPMTLGAIHGAVSLKGLFRLPLSPETIREQLDLPASADKEAVRKEIDRLMGKRRPKLSAYAPAVRHNIYDATAVALAAARLIGVEEGTRVEKINATVSSNAVTAVQGAK